jgi:hypothetical protein
VAPTLASKLSTPLKMHVSTLNIISPLKAVVEAYSEAT